MSVLIFILKFYIAFGVIYGLYQITRNWKNIFGLPFNILGGLPIVIYIVYKTLKREKIYL